MDSVDSKENNREQNATENNDGGSVADESSPPCQSRRDAGFKKLKRMSKQDDSGNDGDDESVGCGNSGSCNSNARVLIKDDFENVGDDDDGSDQDCTSSARDTTLRHVRGDEDANLSWRVEEEKEGHSVEEDPLMESVHSLKVSQEALQQEIEKIKEIGNESVSPDDDDDDDDSTKCRSEAAEANVVDLEFHDSCSSGHSVKQILLSSMELQVAILTEKKNILENKLEELLDELALKDCRILELELALTDEFPKEESTCTIRSLDEKFKMLESLFEQKIEAEINYLTIKREMQNLEVASALAEKQETMSGSEVQNPNKLEVAGNEDSIMKNRTDESGKYRGEILGVEETFMIQGRLCNLTYCLFLQFILLILVLWLIVSKFESNSEGPVPT